MRTGSTPWFEACWISVALALAATPVQAQETDAATPEPEPATETGTPATIPVESTQDAAALPEEEAPADSTRLDDIVITATKRAQSVRDIPVSINAISGEKLEQLGARKLKDIFTLVPGVNMQDELGGIQRKVSVRGVGPDTGSNQTVGSVMGDIPISDPYGATTIVDPNPWDMGTVEILKGPQGTLFGATSLAGLIRYVPNYPELGKWSGKAFYDYTSVELGGTASSYAAAINAPMGDTVAMRVSGILQHLPGLLDSNNPSRHEQDTTTGRSWSGRAMMLWQPSDQLTVNAWYTRDRRTTDDLNLVTFADGTYTRDDAPAPSPAENGYSLATLDVRYAFDWATLVSLTGYQQKDSHNRIETSNLIIPLAQAGISYLRSDRKVDTHGLLQEVRLVSPENGSAFNWIAGAFYSTFSEDIETQLYVPNTGVLNVVGPLLPPALRALISANGLMASSGGYKPLEADEQAIYGEANYNFTDSWRLTLGSRFYQTTVNGVLKTTGASAPNNGASPGTSEKGWSPKVALTWQPSQDLMVYGNVSRGFQFGGFNLPTISSPNIPLSFKSSTLWNYEAGVRTDWFDRTLRIDLTTFFIDWTNPQVKQIDNTGLNSFVKNVGGTHNIGVETTIRWFTPISGLTVEESASYIEARTTVPFEDASGEEVPKGTIMSSSPLLQSVTTLSYAKPFGSFLTQTMLVNSLQGKSWTDITHRTQVGDFSLLSLYLNLTRTDMSWVPALTLSVNNLTNVQKLVAGFSPKPGVQTQFQDVIGNSSYVYTQPRSVVLRLSAEF